MGRFASFTSPIAPPNDPEEEKGAYSRRSLLTPRLLLRLRRHRIPSRLIDAAIEELEEEEIQGEDQLTALLERKYRSLPAGLEPRKIYDRLTRFALYRGYPYEDVREAISERLSDLPDELGDD